MSWLEFRLFQSSLLHAREKMSFREAVSAIQTNMGPKKGCFADRTIFEDFENSSNPDKLAKSCPDKNPKISTFWKHP
jgi:hypothetical protein